jgi:hypothetical protein
MRSITFLFLFVHRANGGRPSSGVSPAADARSNAYRILAEALSGVRGFDVTCARIYHYVDVHVFSLPGISTRGSSLC